MVDSQSQGTSSAHGSSSSYGSGGGSPAAAALKSVLANVYRFLVWALKRLYALLVWVMKKVYAVLARVLAAIHRWFMGLDMTGKIMFIIIIILLICVISLYFDLGMWSWFYGNE